MPPSRPNARTAAIGPPVTRARPRGLVLTVVAVLPLMTASRKRFSVSAAEVLERLFPEQGDDMAGDPPSIDFKSARLLGQAFATDNEPGFGVRQILAA